VPRPVRIHHCTSEPYRFFGRERELTLLDEALAGGRASVVAFVGPGGQGKTAILQHWLSGLRGADAVFLWSFYRGKDADLCLRELYAYAADLGTLPDVSASWCVDHLLPILRRERWALVLDGTEVVQYDRGPWEGRFVHPELGRLLEELASEPMPGVAVLTSRFALPTLASRKHARIVSLDHLDHASARGLLASVGVRGTEAERDAVAEAGGRHAKAVELLGTWLAHFHGGDPARVSELPDLPCPPGASEDEHRVACVLRAFQQTLPADTQDVLALATAFRDPATEERLREYLVSAPVRTLLHETWRREYVPFEERPADWLAQQVQELVDLRLLERVGREGPVAGRGTVLDAHPLVRRAFEHVPGPAGQRQSATARAGFLRGRPDRVRPETLEQAREEIELFHAYCDAGLWTEADSTFRALENPKHRFLAPALERDLLLRFFPEGDWRRPPLWDGFGRWRSLAIALEMLGRYADALEVYREPDAALRGDALLALGRLMPLVLREHVPHPWQALWQAYRCHALCLAGCVEQAVALARTLVPVDVYEWLHVFECLLRAGRLDAIDANSFLTRPPGGEHRWAELARRRMRADWLRVRQPDADLGEEYAELCEAYDRSGLPWERALTRLGYAEWLLARGDTAAAEETARVVRDLARSHEMSIAEADAWRLLARCAERRGDADAAREARAAAVGYLGPARP
jgi:hypothetical protein